MTKNAKIQHVYGTCHFYGTGNFYYTAHLQVYFSLNFLWTTSSRSVNLGEILEDEVVRDWLVVDEDRCRQADPGFRASITPGKI